jgi:hypothetical protein
MWPTFFLPFVMSGPGGLTPGTPFDVGCGQTNTLTPESHLPGLQVGDLMVWQFNIHPGAYSSLSHNPITIPAGWKPYATPKYQSNQEAWYDYAILYRFATADDLDPATSYVAEAELTNGYMCSYVTVHRGANTQCPLAGMVAADASTSSNSLGHMLYAFPVGSKQRVEHVLFSYRTRIEFAKWSGEPVVSIPVGPLDELEHAYDSTVTWTGAAYHSAHFGWLVTSAYDDENWIIRENADQSLEDPNWTNLGCGVVSRGGTDNLFAKFSASSFGSGRHYFEFPVSLVAGQKYTFSFATQRSDWNYAASNQSVAISYVDPSAVERGRVVTNGYAGALIDPSTDHGTFWHASSVTHPTSGVPSVAGGQPVLHFEAQETGTHYVRISAVEGSTGDLEFTGAANENWLVTAVQFRAGYRWPVRVNTYESAIFAGDAASGDMKSAPGYGWVNSGFLLTGGRVYKAVAVNYAGNTIPAFVTPWGQSAVLLPYGTEIDAPAGGDRAENGQWLTNSSVAHLAPSQPAYPVWDSTRRKYYAEFTAIDAGDDYRIYVMPMGVAGGQLASCDFIPEDNTFRAPGAGSTSSLSGNGTVTAGQKIGLLIDFTTAGTVTIKFYKDGTEIASGSVSTSDTTSWKDDEPWTFALICSGLAHPRTPQLFSVNLTGSFSYLPSGAVAWGDPTA